MRTRLDHLLWPALLLILACGARAAERTDSLLRLVGDDVGLCLEFADLDRRLPEVLRSEMVARLETLQLYRDWLESEDHQKLVKSRQGIEKFVGRPFGETAYALFGKSVVLAIYPSPQGPQGVLITRAADPETLDLLLEKWNRQKTVEVEALEHAGRKYARRMRDKEKQLLPKTLYYVRFGNTFALSDQESIIRRMIDLYNVSEEGGTRSEAAAEQSIGSLYDSALYRASQRDLSATSLARAYFNPRACECTANLFAGGGNDPLRAMAAQAWQHCDAIGAGLRYDDGLVVELNLNYGSKGVPANWKKTLALVGERPAFVERIPGNVSVAMAGRVDPAGIANLLKTVIGQANSEKWSGTRQIARGLLLGRDPLDDALPAMGSNWTFYLVPRDATRSAKFPADALFAFELPHDPAMRDAIDNALNTGLNYLAATRNAKSDGPTAVVHTREEGPSRMRWIEQFGEFEPTCAMTSDALVLSTSPATVEQFLSSTNDGKLVGSPLYDKIAGKYFPAASQFLLVNVAAVRRFVQKEPGLFDAKGENGDESEDVAEVLQLFDAAFVAGQIDKDRVRIVAGAVLLPGNDETASVAGDRAP